MGTKRTLEIHRPIIAQLPQNAALLSIVGNTGDEYEWIMNNFVNIRINPEIQYDDFHRNDMWYNCYHIEDNSLSKDFILEVINYGFSDFLVNCIDKGYYAFPFINKKNIAAYNYGADMRHSPLVFGYDSVEKTFDIMDFFRGRSYGIAKASFAEMNNAVLYSEEDYDWYPYRMFHIIKKKKGYQYEFSIPDLIRKLEDYYQSREMNTGYYQFQTNDMEEQLYFHVMEAYESMNYGLKCYDVIMELIVSRKIWLRVLCLIYSHKKIMKLRIEYLHQKYVLDDYDALMRICIRAEHLSLISQNLYLKSRMTEKFKYDEVLLKNMHELKLLDLELIPRLVDNLRSVNERANYA